MSTPIFFVVGAAKAGTTSVYHYLKQHPEIHLHPFKDEACYFCERYGMPITLDEFRDLMTPKNSQALASGDVCSAYLADPAAAEEIAQAYPDAKIIMILRNPVDRAYSLYQWMTCAGYEYLPSFRDALEQERDRLARKLKGPELITRCKRIYLYFQSGLYSRQVQRYLERFPRERILILRYDDLQRDGVAFMQGIYAFLGVRADFVPTIRIHNRAARPWSIRYAYFCRRWLTRFLPGKLIPFLMRLNPVRPATIPLDNELRTRLLRRYAGDIRSTAALTGLDIQSWLTEERTPELSPEALPLESQAR